MMLMRFFATDDKCNFIAYDNLKMSRASAWNHLIENPPNEVSLPMIPISVLNPYRSSHTNTHWRWRILNNDEINELLANIRKEASLKRDFDPKIWKSVSHKYRTVARLPEGMTGKEALVWAHEEYSKIFEHQNPLCLNGNDAQCASTFMRTYTCYEFAKHYSAELTRSEWETFKKAGGRSA